jgi:hypothetical protein
MKPSRVTLPLVKRACDLTLRGGWASLVGFLLFGLVVLSFLFATVHHRDPAAEPPNVQGRSAANADRFPRLIRLWIEQGYFKHGGMWFLQPGDIGYVDEAHPRVYSSGTMGFLQPAHLLERVSYALRGGFSYRLLLLHNQALVWLASGLLGLLGMRMALRMEIPGLRAFVLGLACTAVYQTFPPNLWYFWEIYSTTAAVVFVIAFLLFEDVRARREGAAPWLDVLRGACVFCATFTEWLVGGFLIVAYSLTTILMSPESFKGKSPLKVLVLPGLAAWGVYRLQVIWVRRNFPEVELVGSSFLFRAGLDGSTQYYGGLSDLWSRRFHFFMPHLEPIVQPSFLFVAGGLAVLILAALYLTRLPQLKGPLSGLVTGLGLYGLYVSILSQAAVIHPYMYDILVAVPLVVALFAALPASLERLTHNTGLFTLVSLFTAFVYCFVQLRAYAVAFPLPNASTGW